MFYLAYNADVFLDKLLYTTKMPIKNMDLLSTYRNWNIMNDAHKI
jgi:hypothetical protein